MSTLNVSNITDGTTTVGTEYVVNGSAKAWVNFNGTGTVAIRDSFNVASLTDNGTGSYTLYLSNNMATANYVGHANVDLADVIGNPYALSTLAWTMRSYYPHGTAYSDPPYGWTSIQGDLA